MRVEVEGRHAFRLLILPLLGAALLAGFALASLPWRDHPFRRPRTPFDRSASRAVADGYALVAAANPLIPAGATVVVTTEPRDPGAETYYHRFADALLPGRRALPVGPHVAVPDAAHRPGSVPAPAPSTPTFGTLPST